MSPHSSRSSSPRRRITQNTLSTISESRPITPNKHTTTSTTTNPNNNNNNNMENKVKVKQKIQATGYGQSGQILSRTSSTDLLLKKWKTTYWLQVHPVSLYLFSSLEDMEEWIRLDESIKGLNSHTLSTIRSEDGEDDHEEDENGNHENIDNDIQIHNDKKRNEWKKQCKKLVKWSLDFDTYGVIAQKLYKQEKMQLKQLQQLQLQVQQKQQELLQQQQQQQQQQREIQVVVSNGSELDVEVPFTPPKENPIKNSNNDVKEVKDIKGTKKNENGRKHRSKAGDIEKGLHRPIQYIQEDVRSKYYKKDGPLLHTCKLSYRGLQGRTLAAAFASETPNELKQLRSCIRTCLKLATKKRKSKRSKKRAAVMTSDDADGTNHLIATNHNGGATATTATNTNTTIGKRNTKVSFMEEEEEDGGSDLMGSAISGVSSGMSSGMSAISGVSKTVYGRNTMTKEASIQWGKMNFENKL